MPPQSHQHHTSHVSPKPQSRALPPRTGTLILCLHQTPPCHSAVPSPFPTCGLQQRQLPSPCSPAGEGGLLLLLQAAAVRSRQGGEKKVKQRVRSGREAAKAALSSQRSERPLGGAPAPGAASGALGLPHGSSAPSSAAPQPWCLDHGCSTLARWVCGEGSVRHAGLEPGPHAGFRWETLMAGGLRASCVMM